MDKLDRIHRLHRLLKRRKTPLSRAQLLQKLQLTSSGLSRLLTFCRTRLHMPILFDRAGGGYNYDAGLRERYELPGLWFTPAELRALLFSQQLLADVEPGLLKTQIAPLQQGLGRLLQQQHGGGSAVWQRIRILPVASREARLEDFQQVADALLQRKKLRIVYSSRSSDEVSERWVSPQRLVYYRDNWYLDAWCHLRAGLRTFSLDQLRVLEIDGKAKDIPDRQLDAHVANSYGIFAGPARERAVIHFSAAAARWVADEEWHPEQQSRHLGDGRWELVVPYGNSAELIGDILRFGDEAEVISPLSLREEIKQRLSKALRQYRNMKSV